MPTKNRRVAAYLPKKIDASFEAFKVTRGIEGDSQALIVILSEFLEVSHQVTHPAYSAEYAPKQDLEALSAKVAHLAEQIQAIDGFVERAVDRAISELPSDLLSRPLREKVEDVPGQLELLEDREAGPGAETPSDSNAETELLTKGLSARKLEERFRQFDPRGATRKDIAKQRDLPDFPSWSAVQDPKGIAWEHRDGKFYPIQNATSSLPSESLV